MLIWQGFKCNFSYFFMTDEEHLFNWKRVVRWKWSINVRQNTKCSIYYMEENGWLIDRHGYIVVFIFTIIKKKFPLTPNTNKIYFKLLVSKILVKQKNQQVKVKTKHSFQRKEKTTWNRIGKHSDTILANCCHKPENKWNDKMILMNERRIWI